MKNFSKIALAVALIGGVSATALVVDSASARGWNGSGSEKGQQFKGRQGADRHGDRGARGGDIIKMLDADKDGTLTKEELTTGLAAKITDNDTNGDGAVSLEEFKAEWAKLTQDRMVRAYQKMDRDGNGSVTLEELSEPATAMFDRMDRNDDGIFDKADRPNRSDRADRQGRNGKGMRGEFGPQKGAQDGARNGSQNSPDNGQRGGNFQPSQFDPADAGPDFDGQPPQGPQPIQASYDLDDSDAPFGHPVPPVAQLR
ncbi:EF-hand domain-containing protein [Cohaesibacter celericrescens]|uniref:EF-hand domain-containing protein n=1 Tax=Cohaesibacter celericrescens TaxID=2067669 RepID=A0A2N5XKI4_9HYPH|nr:EF-hand domain-containing protein [Cohaesibacter celericrescens]PLW75033.1 hypothetical protein C0081_22300 [Cohaesibacter celericrescens]